MGIITVGPAEDIVSSIREVFPDIKTFVETGTLQGNTAIWAAGLFDRVFTIEASYDLWGKAQERFRDFPNITAINASSDAGLNVLLPSLPPSLFFLDAHWSGGNTAGAKSECPLLSELSLILPWFRKHVILIDDARLFMRPPSPPHRISEWPSLDDIMKIISNVAYVTIYKDLIVAVPAFFRERMAEKIQRLPQ